MGDVGAVGKTFWDQMDLAWMQENHPGLVQGSLGEIWEARARLRELVALRNASIFF